MTKKYICLVALLSLGVFSCRKSDDNGVQIREMAEVIPENDRDIQAYLRTHFCELDAQKNFILDTLAGGNASKTALWEHPNLKRKVIKALDRHGNYYDTTMYYLILQEGNGTQATVADRSFVLYKGQTLKGKVFDQTMTLRTNTWFDLLGTQANAYLGGAIIGFREGVALMKDSSDSATEDTSTGILTPPTTGGMGIFFLPSPIAYYTGTVGVPAYAPLIFQIKLLKTQKYDHDGDGIPSIDEIIHHSDGTITFPDCNGNNKADYLDANQCS